MPLVAECDLARRVLIFSRTVGGGGVGDIGKGGDLKYEDAMVDGGGRAR